MSSECRCIAKLGGIILCILEDKGVLKVVDMEAR